MAYETWACDACKRTKTVRFPKGEGVTAVKDRISWMHRFGSPKCHNENGITKIRVGVSTQGKEANDER